MNEIAQHEMAAFLDSWLAYRARHGPIPGFSVAILTEDEVVFRGAYGQADLTGRVALTPGHLFGIASQSKMFTATALLQLVEEGRIQLDDAAARHLPWLAHHADERFACITLRQFLTHSAGLGREGDDADYWQLRKPFPTGDELRALVLGMPMAEAGAHASAGQDGHETNVRAKYSNVGFALLGAIVEAVTGTTFADHVTTHVIEPLGLCSTVADYDPLIADRIATGYSLPFAHHRAPLLARMSSNSYAAVMGAYATPEDMCRFAQAQFQGDQRLIGDALKKEAQRAQWQVPAGKDRGRECGLGFEILRIRDRRFIGHSGSFSGYVTGTFFEPAERLALSVMANCRDAPVHEMLRGLVEVVDHFQTHAVVETPSERSRFTARVCNALAALEINATAGQIVAVNPDAWRPFAQAEELAIVDATTLRVVTPEGYFNEGELVHHTFDRDTVASVRFAGITLLPERDYQRYIAVPDAGASGSDGPPGTLCTGTVIAVETCDASSPWRHRLMIEYGDGMGLRRCFTNALRWGLAAHAVGRRVLGIVYPLEWHLGWPTPGGMVMQDVVALGLADRPGPDASLLPGTLIPLMPARANGQCPLPVEVSLQQLARRASGAHQTFKWEPRADYPDMHDLSPSLAPWLRGDREGSRVLMERERDQGVYVHPWGDRGCVRVRVIDETPTPFVEWELEAFARIHIPTLGETIYLLPRAAVSDIDLPSGDVILLDRRCAYINSYDDDRDGFLHYQTVLDADEGDSVDGLLQMEARLMHLATTYGRRLEPVI